MELLLNLLWVAMVLAAFCGFLRKRSTRAQHADIPYVQALLALACVLVLLFPVISASDDLHPTQAVLEDATKRMQQAVAPYQHVQAGLSTAMLPALLAVSLMFALVGVARLAADRMSKPKPFIASAPRATDELLLLSN